MKKSNRIALVIGILTLLAAAVLIGIDVIRKNAAGGETFDFFHLSEDQVGKTVSGIAECQPAPTGNTDYGCLFALYTEKQDEEEYAFVGFDVPKNMRNDYDFSGTSDLQRIPFHGTLKRCDKTRTDLLRTYVEDYCDMLADAYKGTENEGLFTEEVKEKALASISPYYVEVTAEKAARTCFILGITLAALAVLLIVGAVVSPKAVLVTLSVLLGVTLLAAAVFAALNFNKLRTMASVEEISDGLYYMDCKYDYDCDKFLNANISTIDDFIGWTEDELFFSQRIPFHQGNLGCASFTAASDSGHRLFGRNFDYSKTDTLVFHTAPENGYESYAVTDLRFFGIGRDLEFEGDSLTAKAIMLAAPYVSMDGINEKGVGVSVLELTVDELHQDNGKPDLFISSAIRGILDKCASIDEAINLLAQYDIHSYLDRSYHLFITDRSGRSVVVEWSGNETLIVEDNAVTNDVLSSDHAQYRPDWQCDRYDAIKRELESHQSVFSQEEAMQVLNYAASAGSNDRGTQWSCIYDLDAFTLNICIDRDYDHVIRFADGKPVR